MYEWLVRRARTRWPGRIIETRPLPLGPGTPYDTSAPDGTRYVSFADWICPTHCIEPAICEHRVFGVGMFDVGAVLAGDATVASAGQERSPVDVLVGTVSKCHGAVNLLHLG